MKSNYIRNRSETERIAREAAREELKKQKREVCPQCEQMITNQVCAVMCKALHDRYGFGKKRIAELLSCAQAFADFINGKQPDGKDYTPMAAVEWLKTRYGIDLEKMP